MTRYRPVDEIDHSNGGMTLCIPSDQSHSVTLGTTSETPSHPTPRSRSGHADAGSADRPAKLTGNTLPASRTARDTFTRASNTNPTMKNTTSDKIATR
jgi:hypothetical protein